MSPLIRAAALVALVGCSGRQTLVGAGVGVGVMATGGVVIATSSSDENSARPFVGYGVAVAGLGIVVVSLVAGALGLVHLPPASPPQPPRDVSGGRTCQPVAPDSSLWTCGDGYRCTDDFAGCEPAAGAPLRQR